MPARHYLHKPVGGFSFEKLTDRVVTPISQYRKTDPSLKRKFINFPHSEHLQHFEKDLAETRYRATGIPGVSSKDLTRCGSVSSSGSHSLCLSSHPATDNSCFLNCNASFPCELDVGVTKLEADIPNRTLLNSENAGSCAHRSSSTDDADERLILDLSKSSFFISKYFPASSPNFHLKKAISLNYANSMKSASSQSSSPTTVLSVLSGHSAVTTTVPFCQPHSFLSDCQGTLEHSLESRSSQGKKQSHTSRFGQMPDSSVSSVHTGDASPLDCAENRGSHKKQETFSISNGDMFLAKKGMEHRDQIVTPTGSYPSGNVDALDTTWSHGLGKQTALVRKDFLTDFTSPVKVKRPRYSTCSNTEFVVDSSQEGSSNEKTDEAEPVETKASLDDSSQLPHTTGRWEISPKGMYNGHCQVCGDLAAGFYCGAFVCEACKKFFIRASKQEKQKFVCLHQGTCKITKESRVQCQYCRYQRCLELQMYYPGEGKRSVVRVGIAEIPCKVCGAPSSGFHFGALTCEGCKGFFRRMVKEREPGTYRCSAGGSCDISLHTRNMCKACRYQKCLNIGMSVEGSRIGRQPNAVKHAISLEVKKKCLQTGAEVRPSLRTSSLSGYASSVTATFHQSTPVSVSPPVPAPTVVHIKEETTSSPFSFTDVELMEVPASQLMCVKEEPEDDLDYQMLEDSLEAAAIELAHIPKKERSKSDIFDEQKFTLLSTTWKKMMEHFEFHAQCVIRFAKKVPDFRKLPIDDQVTLVQHSTYPIVILNHARGYELDTGYYNYFNFSKQEEEAVFEKAPLFKNLVVHFKHMGLMAQTMKMTDLEYTLLSCLLLLDSECQGLQSVKEVMAMQNRIIRLFEMYEERTCENGSSRFGEIMLRISELALANVQHTQIITTFVSGNPDLEVPKLFEEMFF